LKDIARRLDGHTIGYLDKWNPQRPFSNSEMAA
jgi:hypothetical protein